VQIDHAEILPERPTQANTAVGSAGMQPDDSLTAITYCPVGVVRSPFTRLEGMPLQSVAADQIRARVEIRTELQPGLRDLDGFSHLHLITHLHRGAPGALRVVPFLDETVRGIFATRSPRHPNPIGLSIVRLVEVTGSTLEISGVDLLDGTPVLDIKPYVPTFDCVSAERTGWLENAAERVHHVKADRRFADPPDTAEET
jgi:tRNA-Thr(GGU) m(6)t(6)A37 methyltransferase TsaA